MYKNDVNLEKLERQLSFLPDVIQVALPSVKTVTSVRTVCEAMKANKNRELLEEVHKLLRLYITIPITTSTAERSFSTLRRVLTYMRSTMTEKRLNNCLMLHIHKDLTDELDINNIASTFVSANNERLKYFGSFV